jgi:hypothetical protein
MTAASSAAATAQETPLQQPNATALISQMSSAFSGSQVIHQITLSGNATWHAGSLVDSGPATLTASSDGQFHVTLQLSGGQKLEGRTGTGTTAACSYSGADGVAHNVDLANCWKPAVWFLPAISLPMSLLSNSLIASDLGQGAIGSGTGTYRHLQARLQLSGLSPQTLAHVTQQSVTDMGLDTSTMLPVLLAYRVYPDNGLQVVIAIEVHYSDYRDVNGVKIPFLIQRYINNSLQLEIAVESVSVN